MSNGQKGIGNQRDQLKQPAWTLLYSFFSSSISWFDSFIDEKNLSTVYYFSSSEMQIFETMNSFPKQQIEIIILSLLSKIFIMIFTAI